MSYKNLWIFQSFQNFLLSFSGVCITAILVFFIIMRGKLRIRLLIRLLNLFLGISMLFRYVDCLLPPRLRLAVNFNLGKGMHILPISYEGPKAHSMSNQ